MSDPSSTSWTVSQVTNRVTAVVNERMRKRLWVRGDLVEVSRTNWGMLFGTLVETKDKNVVATIRVVADPATTRRLDRKIERVGQQLGGGLTVCVQGQLGFYEAKGRLQFELCDIDSTYTVGALALARQKLLAALDSEGLTTANAERPITDVPLRIGLVTRYDSQAYHDIVDALSGSGWAFALIVVSTSVQGQHAPAQLRRALALLDARNDIDVIAVSRGGGGELDLAAFDDELVARQIATCRHQVWTGIGHHLDRPVAEIIAARRFNTPTALAEGLLERAENADETNDAKQAELHQRLDRRVRREHGFLDRAEIAVQGVGRTITAAGQRLNIRTEILQRAVRRAVNAEQNNLATAEASITNVARRTLHRATQETTTKAALLSAHDPATLFARGWSRTQTIDGDTVTGPVAEGTTILTVVRGGTITSVATESAPTQKEPK